MYDVYCTIALKLYYLSYFLLIFTVFEGWYWRITLPGNAKSFALIYSVEDPLGNSPFSGVGAQVMGPDDGYILQYSKYTSNFWADPTRLALGCVFCPYDISKQHARSDITGVLPRDKFNNKVREGFQASATFHQGRIVANDSGASGYLPSTVNSCSWELSIVPMTAWGDVSGRQRATAGWLASLPVFEPHWQVLMSHGEASGWIEWGGERYEFTGAPAYAEKNWGGGFPSKWAWIQCNSFLNSPGTSVTAVGAQRGVLLLPGVEENVGLIGIHHRGAFYELNIRDSEIRWTVSPWGRWIFEGKSREWEAVVEAECSSTDGTPLRAPTATDGLAPFCRDSFAGIVTLKVWRAGGRSNGKEPIIDVVSEGKSGAVEVGGGPWWSDWIMEAKMSEPVKQLLNLPIDVESLTDFLPPIVRPPGL